MRQFYDYFKRNGIEPEVMNNITSGIHLLRSTLFMQTLRIRSSEIDSFEKGKCLKLKSRYNPDKIYCVNVLSETDDDILRYSSGKIIGLSLLKKNGASRRMDVNVIETEYKVTECNIYGVHVYTGLVNSMPLRFYTSHPK